MVLNLRDPDDYFSFLRRIGRLNDELSSRDIAETRVDVGLWTPSVRADTVAQEIGNLDTDMRLAAALPTWGSSHYGRRFPRPFLEEFWEFGYLGSLWAFIATPIGQPVEASEGGLEVVRATQGDSINIDFQAIGLVLGMLVDTPAAFIGLRAILRRLPVRVVWTPSGPNNNEPQVIEASPAGRDDIEARRLVRRITLRYADGSELIEEEFALPSSGAD